MMRWPVLTSRPRWTFWGQNQKSWMTMAGTALLLLFIVWLGSGLQRAWSQQQTLRDVRQSIVEAQTRLNKPAIASATSTSPDAAKPRSKSRDTLQSSPQELTSEQRRQLSSVIRQLNTPWQDVFEQIEADTPKDIALISIEPDAKRAVLRLQAEATTLETLLSYAARVQYQGVLGLLTYSKHETNEQDPNKPIRLTVEYSLQTPSRLQRSGVAKDNQK